MTSITQLQPSRKEDSSADDAIEYGENKTVKTTSDPLANPSTVVENVESEESEDRSVYSRINNNLGGFLFPKMTPTPIGTFIVLTLFATIPAAGYIVYFTKIGYGLTTFYYISDNYEQYGGYLGGGIAAGAFLLYLFDCYYWSSSVGVILRKLFVGILILAIALLTLIMAGEHPYGPISLFLVLSAGWMVMIRQVIYSDVEPRVFVSWLSGPFFLVAITTFAGWLTWALYRDENEWNSVIKVVEAERSGCEPDYESYPNLNCQNDDGDLCFDANIESYTLNFDEGCDELCVDVFSGCANSFIIWVGPFLVSLGYIFLSFFATFLRKNSSVEEEASKFAKIWLFLLFAMWVGASLSGAGAGISTTLAALILSSFIAAAIFIAVGFNQIERQEQIQKMEETLVEKYGNHFDIFRGLLIVTTTPIFLFYFIVSFVIQRIRDLPCCYTKPPPNTTSLRDVVGSGWLTSEARRLIRRFMSWNRTKVLTYAVYWGIAFMIMNVIVARFTLVFLSWLIEATSSMPLEVVTGVLVGVGLIMFLLPPVPGVPIYLTLGIVIIPVGKDTFGIVGSILYAHAVSLCLKLLACTLQQKAIGGLLQGFVGVRQFCGVNTSVMRSMKLVLRQPGLGLDKVSILVGGPDWPTSVLCGIMGLDLIPILVGTLPVIFLIIPTLLTGSFTYMSGVRLDNGKLEFPWAGTVATIFAAITAFVQFGSMVIAAFYLEQTVSTRQEELDAIPIDEEVKERDDADEVINKKYYEVTEWSVLPLLIKVVLSLSITTMILSCYLVQLFASECFREFEITSKIDQHLDGDWKRLVKPLGVVANILLLASCFLFYIFRQWAMRKAKS